MASQTGVPLSLTSRGSCISHSSLPPPPLLEARSSACAGSTGCRAGPGWNLQQCCEEQGSDLIATGAECLIYRTCRLTAVQCMADAIPTHPGFAAGSAAEPLAADLRLGILKGDWVKNAFPFVKEQRARVPLSRLREGKDLDPFWAPLQRRASANSLAKG